MSKDGHGNVAHKYRPAEHIDVRKVPADSVPYGSSISRNGKFVWCAYDGERLVCVAATAPEARRKYREAKRPH